MVDPRTLLYQQMTSSPLFNRAQQMADGKSPAELEQIARNICVSKGVNYDEAVKAFRQIMAG